VTGRSRGHGTGPLTRPATSRILALGGRAGERAGDAALVEPCFAGVNESVV